MKIEMDKNNTTLWSSFLVALTLFCAPLYSQQSDLHIYHPGIDVLHYTFTLELPDTGRFIQGYAELTVRRYRPVEKLRLDLIALRVDTVWINSKPVQFLRDSATISIPLKKLSRPSADTFTVVVKYGGAVKDGLIIGTDEAGRWTGFGDNWPNRGRYWIPSVDHPSDKATVTWNIRAPSDRKVIANGALLEERRLPETKSFSGKFRTLTRWSISRPIPVYLMVIAAAPLTSFDLGLNAVGLSEFAPGVRQTVYVAPEIRDYLPGPFVSAGAIVEFFARTVGPFPYEKLAHLQSTTRYGGMENASAIFYNDNTFREREMTVGLIAHETAHQWFGDAVTPRSWGHLWLSEGFATYFEKLWVQKSRGDPAFREEMSKLRSEILQARESHERPVIDSLQSHLVDLLNTNSYQKGAWTLHMLRSLLGDSLFFSGIRSYYSRFRHQTAVTEELCEQFERISGKELGWFFDQWLRRPGFPIVTARWKYDKKERRVELEIVQGKRFPPYRFPLTVEVLSQGGYSQRATIEIPAQQ
ncbi:MAG: M1 family metallopeptidase, partial [Bacteroidota bacterium]